MLNVMSNGDGSSTATIVEGFKDINTFTVTIN